MDRTGIITFKGNPMTLLGKADALFGHMETTVAEVTQPNVRDDDLVPDLPFKSML